MAERNGGLHVTSALEDWKPRQTYHFEIKTLA